ncbi:putative uncharacterized protein DDB_G0286333 [Chironomus tepperi]|uniref:putative uncharacterized protein DDB_G0286333 n=1 Tax=Chironomus tepperi TaxID=113505 RepID=UPI00391EF5F4
MLGNQSNGNCNKPVFRNARLFGPNCIIGNGSNNSNNNNNSKSAATATTSIISNNGSKNQTTEHQSDFIEDDFNDYTKTDIPEMKLLPMEYVGKVKSKPKPKCPPPPPPIKNAKCKCPASSNDGKPTAKSALKVTINAPESASEKASSKLTDKYLVYKQKHSIFGTSKDILNGKLKYVSDNNKSSVDAAIQDAQKSKEGKKKYLIFDSKKNNSSKFETIQYYFDNKSYEKYVDTKLYGRLNHISNPQPILKNNNSNSNVNRNIDDDDDDDDDDIDDIDLNSDIDMRGFENSRSWEYRDNAKTESKLKLFESKQKKQESSKKSSSQFRSSKSEGSGNISGASSCSEVLLKRQNCRLKPQQKLTTSKSIGDLTAINKSSKTNHDVKRINQLFENAKQSQVTIGSALKSNIDNNDKYKIHKVVRDDSIVVGDRGNLCRENMKKYHRSSTDLSIKSPISKPSSCGFKNCKLSNCPISHHTNHNSPPSPSVPMVNERRSKFDENFIKKFEDMMKNSSSTNSNNNCILRNNEITVNKTNISVNGKSNIIVNDTKNNFSPSSCHDVLIINSDCSSTNHEKEVQHSKANNNNNNNNNKTTIKINDSCFVVNNNDCNDGKFNNNEKNKNIIELNSEKVMTPTNWDKNIKVKNNPQPKFNNKIDVNNKIKNEENSVKIYVIGNDNASSPTPSASFSTISSTSPDTSSSSDSDKDDGYYDASSQGRSSSPEFSEMFKKLRDLCNANTKQVKKHQPHMKFGYDGTLFWNNSYFDEDETDFMMTAMNNNNKGSISRKNEKMSSSSSTYACTKCHTTTEDLLSNYICICRNKDYNCKDIILTQFASDFNINKTSHN